MAIKRAGENTISYLLEKIKTALGGKIDKSGGTMTGALTLSGAPEADLQAANKGYVDAKLASNTSVTLTASGWSDNSQTVAAAGVTASNNIIVSPAPDYISAYINGSIRCTAQSDGALTFVCSTVPTVDITVNLIIN